MTVAFRMPVQAPDPLEEHVHWTEVRHEEVEVDVERLLHELSAYENHPSLRVRDRLSERCLHGAVEAEPIRLCIPRVIGERVSAGGAWSAWSPRRRG